MSSLLFSSCRANLPILLGITHELCDFAEDFEILHGVSFAAN